MKKSEYQHINNFLKYFLSFPWLNQAKYFLIKPGRGDIGSGI